MNNLTIRSILLACVLSFQGIQVTAQQSDSEYEQLIKQYTTDDRFYPSSVAKIVDHASISSPLDHFGTIIGAPMVMHNTNEIYGYYKLLAEQSDRLKVEQIGTSEEGRAIHLIAISDAENLINAEAYKSMLRELADPRSTDEERAKEIAIEGKSVYYLNGGMHSTEMGSPEMLMELAYRLITDESEEIKHIRENVIVLINPVSEPDGRDKQVDWYHRYSKHREQWDDGFPRSTPYWGKYVFHDNNRDGLQISQEITKNIFKIFYDWHPNVMLDLHESVPLLYISTGTGPYNDNVDPITVGEWQTIANYEMTSLSAQGLPGVFHWAFYDGWWPGYGVWVANTHNSIGRFYETFGNAGANTYLRDLTKSKYAGDPVTSKEWYRPDPASGMVNWSARNNTNYMQAGVLASLTYAADNRSGLLKNFYKKGQNNVAFGSKNKVKQFRVLKNQKDPVKAAYLINQLMAQGIEVHKVIEGEGEGDYLIQLNQPYSKLAYDLLTEQNYPKDAKFPPYDAIAWTLDLLYGVDLEKEEQWYENPSTLQLLTENVVYSGKVDRASTTYAINYKAQSNVVPALFDLKGTVKAYVIDSSKKIETHTLAPGSIIIENLGAKKANELASKFGLDLIAVNEAINDKRLVDLPKIAVYHSWTDTQAEGWVRYTFEQLGVPYTSIDKDDLKAGRLSKDFDVIVIPHFRRGMTQFVHGVDEKFGPMPFTKTKEYPSHGYPDQTDDMTGGPGFDGLNKLNEFVKNGGVLVPLDNAAAIIADLGIGGVLSSYRSSRLFHPGSIVTAKARNAESPILFGYPEEFHLYKGNTPMLRSDLIDRKYMVAQFGDEPLADENPYTGEIMGLSSTDQTPEEVKESGKPRKYVMSGMVRNEKDIIGTGAIYSVPHGKGHIVSFAFNPLDRFLNHHDSGLFWNVIIHWNHL